MKKIKIVNFLKLKIFDLLCRKILYYDLIERSRYMERAATVTAAALSYGVLQNVGILFC